MAQQWRRYANQSHARFTSHSSEPARRHVAGSLLSLTGIGWSLLVDQRWPGPGTPAILIGPPGVFPIETRTAAQSGPGRGPASMVALGPDEHDDGSLSRFTDLVEEAVSECHLAPAAIQPIIAGQPATAGQPIVAGQPIRPDTGEVAPTGRARRVTAAALLPALLELPPRLKPDHIKALVTRLAAAFPSYRLEKVSDGAQLDHERSHDDPAAVEEVVAALDRASLGPSPEAWMTFLHPDQLALVRRHFGGPARIGGAPGTGKTVVGLHRAAYLAQRGESVLYVSAAPTLPQVQASLFRLLAPGLADRVEFVELHDWAARLLREHGHAVQLDHDGECFAAAWDGRGGSLAQLEPQPQYWHDEITYVIKGRGVTDLETYLQQPRPGRRVRLQRQHRHAVWELYEAYEGVKKQRELMDLADVVTEALAQLRRDPASSRCTAVIADEVQDLSVAAVTLLHELGGDGPDGLLLIGDANQTVNPVGRQLAEASITIRGGRSETLRHNYRNSSAIIAAARAATRRPPAKGHDSANGHDSPNGRASSNGSDPFEDLGLFESLDPFEDLDGSPLGDIPMAQSTVSAGSKVPDGEVINVVTRSGVELDRALLRLVRDLAEVSRPGLTSVAVLCADQADVDHYLTMLSSAGESVAALDGQPGGPNRAISVGTIRQGKGLEFDVVLLPRFDEPADQALSSGATGADRLALAHRQLYVGITRARRLLWLGQVRSAR